jgi:N-acetylmuramoyl-L-alanine amidase
MAFGRMLNQRLQREPGFAPVLLRHGDGEVISVPARAMHAADAKADIVVSLHVDSSVDPTRHGSTSLYWPGNKVGQRIAKQIALAWPPVLRRDFKSRPATKKQWKDANYVIGCYKNVTAVLVEFGFGSNPRDVIALCEDTVHAQMINAILQGLLLFRQMVIAPELDKR